MCRIPAMGEQEGTWIIRSFSRKLMTHLPTVHFVSQNDGKSISAFRQKLNSQFGRVNRRAIIDRLTARRTERANRRMTPTSAEERFILHPQSAGGRPKICICLQRYENRSGPAHFPNVHHRNESQD